MSQHNILNPKKSKLYQFFCVFLFLFLFPWRKFSRMVQIFFFWSILIIYDEKKLYNSMNSIWSFPWNAYRNFTIYCHQLKLDFCRKKHIVAYLRWGQICTSNCHWKAQTLKPQNVQMYPLFNVSTVHCLRWLYIVCTELQNNR